MGTVAHSRFRYNEVSLIRFSAAILLLAGLVTGRCFGQRNEQNQLDGNPALFTVMAAINAAGYDAEINSTSNHPLRLALRNSLAGRKLESVEELKHFFANHRQPNWNAEVNQYISFGLSIEGPPNFAFHFG